MHKRGDRVEARGPGGTVRCGTVLKREGIDLYVKMDNGEGILKGPACMFRDSDTPATGHGVLKKWKKGDRVEFPTQDRGTVYGTVSKGGSLRITVIQDETGETWTVGAQIAQATDKEAPKDDFDDPMADYTVKSYRVSKVATDEGYPWECKIYYKGKHIIDVTDPATGGSVHYWPVGTFNRGAVEKAHDDAAKWLRLCGCPEEGLPSDPLDLWIPYAVHLRPTGMTGKAYYENEWKAYAENIAEMKENNS